jgi:hypothetical protein
MTARHLNMEVCEQNEASGNGREGIQQNVQESRWMKLETGDPVPYEIRINQDSTAVF